MARLINRSLICFTLIFTSPVAGQVALRVEQVMTQAEMQETGIARLTAVEREALSRWLSQYTLRVLRVGASQTNTRVYSGLGGGHWVSNKIDSGNIIVLEDGSMWEIQSIDRIFTRLWLRITAITVLEASTPIGDYRYRLVNTDDNESVLAKYLGKR